jgi:hypothetical protein
LRSSNGLLDMGDHRGPCILGRDILGQFLEHQRT